MLAAAIWFFLIVFFHGYLPKNDLPMALRGDSTALWDLSDLPKWEVAEEYRIGLNSDLNRGTREVVIRHGRSLRKMYVHIPPGSHRSGSLPCVLVPPSGSNQVTGQTINGGVGLLQAYLKAGIVVITYPLDGPLASGDEGDAKKFRRAYLAYVNSKAGLNNSMFAFRYAQERIDIVDDNQIYVAGYSSGGTHALLFAAHQPRLAGCVAYCPDPRLGDYNEKALQVYGRFLPGLERFVDRATPMTHVTRIQCPVLVFGVMDDAVIDFDDILAFDRRLKRVNPAAMLKWQDAGGHFEPYRESGIKLGSKWIKQRAQIER